MIDYMRKHESFVREALDKNPDAAGLASLLEYHNKQLEWMQHERIVHLLVMLFVCLFMLLSWGFAIINTSMPVIALALLLLILSVAYIIHYYRLENGVQKWYLLSNAIKQRLERMNERL